MTAYLLHNYTNTLVHSILIRPTKPLPVQLVVLCWQHTSNIGSLPFNRLSLSLKVQQKAVPWAWLSWLVFINDYHLFRYSHHYSMCGQPINTNFWITESCIPSNTSLDCQKIYQYRIIYAMNMPTSSRSEWARMLTSDFKLNWTKRNCKKSEVQCQLVTELVTVLSLISINFVTISQSSSQRAPFPDSYVLLPVRSSGLLLLTFTFPIPLKIFSKLYPLVL